MGLSPVHQGGKAYVDEQSAEEIAAQKGTPTEPGKERIFRNRPVEENLRLFQEMNEGQDLRTEKWCCVPRLTWPRLTCTSRDPIMYRIITTHPHHRTGNTWKVYPMYDFAHGQSDYFRELPTRSARWSLRNRPLYNWFIDQFADSDYRPKQREFNRLNLTYTVASKTQNAAAGEGRVWYVAGTTPACLPSADCAAAATRLRPFTISYTTRLDSPNMWD